MLSSRPERQFRTGLCFTRDFSLFFDSPSFLPGPSTDRRETLPHDRKLAELYNPSAKNWTQTMRNFDQFWIISHFDREYLQNEATHPKSERSTN